MRVLTVGGATIDTISIIASAQIEQISMRNAESSFLLLEEGGKTEAQQVSIHCGGGAVNAAVAMSRLGMDVSILAKLGTDSRAETLMSGLMHERVSTRWLVRDHRAPTGASSLISSHDRNAAVFTFRGANTLLEPEDLHDDAFVVDLVYVANLSNKSAEVFPSIVGKAKQFGARVAVNPGARQLAAYGESFCQCLPLIDILSLNRAEAGILLASLAGKAVKDEVAFDLPSEGVVAKAALKCLHGDGHDMTVATFLRTLTRLGPRYVVLTDGSRGAFVATPDEIVFCPALPCTVVGTAGAGDAFASTFAACIALGQTVQDAVRAATLNAGSVVGYADTQTGLMQRAPLDAAVKAAEENLPLWRLWRAATPRPERAENPAEEEPVT